MSNIDELLAYQNQLISAVSRGLANYKKLGQQKMTPAVTRNRLASLKETFQKSLELDGKINLLADEKTKATHIYFTEKYFLRCEDLYNEAADYMAEMLEQHQSTGQDTSSNVSRLHDSGGSSYHLPKIQLPTFDGSFDHWESFRDKFRSMIHDDPSLSDLKRLHYLCSCLKGDASKALDDIDIVEANYDLAWNRLISRYENKRKLVTFRLQSLFNLPVVTSETSRDLRDLRDQTNKIIHSLRNLGRPVEHWDDVIVYIVAQKLDKSTKKAWELKLGKSVEYPRYRELDEFLDARICGLESILLPKDTKSPKGKAIVSHAASTVNLSCPSCKANHLLYQCPTFVNQTPSQRYEFIKNCKRCVNCLSAKHVTLKECGSSRVCKQCQKRHHTLLHFESPVPSSGSNQPSTNTSIDKPDNKEVTSHLLSRSVSPMSQILLATARVRVHSRQGRHATVRALIDQGSAATVITESLVQSLRLPKTPTSVRVVGIGEKQSVVRHTAHVTITPASSDGPAYSTNALLLKSLTRYSPSRLTTNSRWNHIAGLELADSKPMSNDPIDIIIGADLFSLIILEGVRKGADGEPIAQNTTLGWIISGPISSSPNYLESSVPIHHGTILENLDSSIRRFWETEEIPQQPHMTNEERQCEEHFVATHSRTCDGRYLVRLPFKTEPPIPLGDSRSTALSSLQRMEQRLKLNPAKATEYSEFLFEYEQLGHMIQVSPTESAVDSSQRYYIPHHAVLRDSSATTRLRVVFNASCRTSNGTSLNDHLLVGPKLQTDLTRVIMQWRQYRYVYTADIAKMYRQILLDIRDTDYQRILWRAHPSDAIKEYRLLTVTYGTTSAPYLALRVLKQLASDEGACFPLAVPLVEHQIYVDDCLFGADDKILALQTRDQIIELLAKGGFRLRKWASNTPDLLSDIDSSDHGLACDKSLEFNEQINILGITWDPRGDSFQFRVATMKHPETTKRTVLSTIAKFYDPLGWITPVIVTSKIFMQRLWSLKLDWDESLPSDCLEYWQEYYVKLSCLENISVPRWTHYGSDTLQGSLHGFSDASTKAYAAAVYLRLVHVDGSVTVTLLTAKSRVAPLKTISIPRLELSAAHLLAKLMVFIKSTLQLHSVDCHCWTDSTITLAWLSQSPSRWKTFIANRVSAIQTLLPDVTWRHVPTKDNPADCASRGVAPDEMAEFRLWWSGPSWLLNPSDTWPSSCPLLPPTVPLEERTLVTVSSAQILDKWDLATRFSSWPRLLRVTAYVIRFTQKIRRHAVLPVQPEQSESANFIALSPDEIQEAKRYWLKTMQLEMFPDELSKLQNQSPVPKSSSLASLNPYVDSQGLLRVGGRLRHSRLPDSTKNPIVIRSHPLLSLLIMHHHLRTLHGGPQLTLASLRNEFWILRARSAVRNVIYRCIPCTRETAKIPVELMGDLPDVRVNRSSRAFVHTGVDYAGPLLVRTTPGRGHKSHKSYIALFICLTVKAIHLELVSDYSSAAFIAAYQRFVSRRGVPSAMYSDNGTTFHGADREMKTEYFKAIHDPNFINTVATDKVEWHYLPPAAPHFGGLWEAGVRSVKHHLKRCLGNHTFTFEEIATFLCRVEACLNSRPIAAVSENLDDYQPLTPGHFLIGTALIAPPAPSLLEIRENRLSRWQLVQRCSEGFWKSWSSDYLHTLQQRPKWRIVQRLAKVGQIVLLRNSLAPPCQWELGRITACHPGDDGLTRVVTVKTCRSEYKRPLTKLCFLPVDVNVESAMDPVMAGGGKP